jgi:hypothetical protein
MPIITQIHHSQWKKLQYHENNLNSSDFFDLLSLPLQ